MGATILSVRLTDPADAGDASTVLASLAAGEQPRVDAADGEIRLAVDDPTASAEAVRRLDTRRLRIAAVELHQPTLDDVFLTLTGHDSRTRAGRPITSTEGGRLMSAIANTAPDRGRVTLSRDLGRQPGDGNPPAAQGHAQTDVCRLPVRSAGDLRAPLPLRVRRRDQDGPRELRRLPDAWNHRDDRDLRCADYRAWG